MNISGFVVVELFEACFLPTFIDVFLNLEHYDE